MPGPARNPRLSRALRVPHRDREQPPRTLRREGQVTFRYRDGRKGTVKRCTLDVLSFLGRFLQHLLPQGFSKVRHYGRFSPARHDLLAQAHEQLMAAASSPVPAEVPIAPATVPEIGLRSRCPVCGIGVLHLVEILHPGGRSP
jgi:hypothetical protein